WPVALLSALVLQSTLLDRVAVLGVKPDLVLLLTVHAALSRGPIAAMLIGYGAGMLQDALGGGVLGSGAWSDALCGAVVGSFRGTMFRDHLTTHVAVALFATWVAGVGFFL